MRIFTFRLWISLFETIYIICYRKLFIILTNFWISSKILLLLGRNSTFNRPNVTPMFMRNWTIWNCPKVHYCNQKKQLPWPLLFMKCGLVLSHRLAEYSTYSRMAEYSADMVWSLHIGWQNNMQKAHNSWILLDVDSFVEYSAWSICFVKCPMVIEHKFAEYSAVSISVFYIARTTDFLCWKIGKTGQIYENHVLKNPHIL